MQYSYKLCLMPLEARFVPVNPSKVYEDEQLSHKNGILNEVIGKPRGIHKFPTLTHVFIEQQFVAYNCFLNYKFSIYIVCFEIQ